ncbi:MAG: flagellar biosynthetic protein FliR [Spirochaetes bacterium]|nr:flagellar biosynthetic protein FliR [Spirochaetota bacterium]
MFDSLIADADLFFLIAVRVLAVVETAPLLSSEGIPQPAKVALAGFAAVAVYPGVKAAGYPLPTEAGAYLALLVGEALIGVAIGFFLGAVQAAFTTAGQFFSLQMGFGASEVYDPLSQIEIPVMGQFLNLVAMLVFLTTSGFQKVFLFAAERSFMTMKAIDIVLAKDRMFHYLLAALPLMFQNAMLLALPILGTLFIVSVAMGLLSKAAPQINIMSESFPISIGAAFLILFGSLPFLMEAFSRLLEAGFEDLSRLAGGA